MWSASGVRPSPPEGTPVNPGSSLADPGSPAEQRRLQRPFGRPALRAGPRQGERAHRSLRGPGLGLQWSASSPLRRGRGGPCGAAFKAWPLRGSRWSRGRGRRPAPPGTSCGPRRALAPTRPSAEGERASQPASRASRRRHGPERPDGHGRGLRRPGAACGPVRPGRPPPRPSCWAPGLVASGARRAPQSRPPAPGPPRAWAGPPMPPPGSLPLPQPGPCLRARRLPAPRHPKLGLGGPAALAPPARRGARRYLPGPRLPGAQLWACPPPDRPGWSLDAEGRQRLSPASREGRSRGPGVGCGRLRERPRPSAPLGGPCHACPSTGHSWGRILNRGLVRLEA